MPAAKVGKRPAAGVGEGAGWRLGQGGAGGWGRKRNPSLVIPCRELDRMAQTLEGGDFHIYMGNMAWGTSQVNTIWLGVQVK